MSENREIEITVDENEAGQRLDAFLSGKIPDVSRNYIQKLIEDNLVLVNGQSTKAKVRTYPGMKITVYVPQPEPLRVKPENIPLDIVYEDSDILIINKPRNMVVHPAPGNEDNTLVNAVLYHCGDSLSDINGIISRALYTVLTRIQRGLLPWLKTTRPISLLPSSLRNTV